MCSSDLGEGGFSDLYIGASYDVWKKRLAIGFNAGYLFGDITHSRNLIFPGGTGADNVYRKKRYDVRDLKLDFGVQYTHPLSKTEKLTVGATYSLGKKVNTTVYDTQLVGSAASSYTKNDTIKDYRFDIPNSYGLGVSYVKEHFLTLAADLLYEDWAKSHFDNEKGLFKNRTRIGLGAEYIPHYGNRAYFGRVRYRVGFNFTNSYLRVGRSEENMNKGHGYNEYGASIGFGLPLVDNRSLVNLSFQYVKVRPQLRTMIDEQYFRFTVNYSFNELWFFKRKVN